MSKRPNSERVDRASKPAGGKRGHESLIPQKGPTSGMKAPPKAAKAPAKKK